MKFDDLDKRMRVFETVHDQCVPPGIYMVARLDGRCFTRLTPTFLPRELYIACECAILEYINLR